MTTQTDRAATFLAGHRSSSPLLMPNPWDVGSARLLESLGFEALATTSGGFAASLGRTDGSVTREEALAHAEALAAAVSVPVSADLENCFADAPSGVAATVEAAVSAGLAGCSVEDFSKDPERPIYELALATDRVAAAVEAAHRGPVHLVLTARAENLLHGPKDLDETIARLQAYEAAGADVLMAPGLSDLGDIARVVSSVGRPVSVIAVRGRTVAELADAGVARISVGSSFAWVAMAALAEAGAELRAGTFTYSERAAAGRAAALAAFGG